MNVLVSVKVLFCSLFTIVLFGNNLHLVSYAHVARTYLFVLENTDDVVIGKLYITKSIVLIILANVVNL